MPICPLPTSLPTCALWTPVPLRVAALQADPLRSCPMARPRHVHDLLPDVFKVNAVHFKEIRLCCHCKVPQKQGLQLGPEEIWLGEFFPKNFPNRGLVGMARPFAVHGTARHVCVVRRGGWLNEKFARLARADCCCCCCCCCVNDADAGGAARGVDSPSLSCQPSGAWSSTGSEHTVVVDQVAINQSTSLPAASPASRLIRATVSSQPAVSISPVCASTCTPMARCTTWRTGCAADGVRASRRQHCRNSQPFSSSPTTWPC